MRVLPVRHALSHGPSTSFSSEGLSLSCWIHMQQFFAGQVDSASAACVTEGEALLPACLPAACLPVCLPTCLPACLPLHLFIFSAGRQPAGSSTMNNGDDRWCLWAALCRRHAGDTRGPSTSWGVTAHCTCLSECQGRVFFRKASRPSKKALAGASNHPTSPQTATPLTKGFWRSLW